MAQQVTWKLRNPSVHFLHRYIILVWLVWFYCGLVVVGCVGGGLGRPRKVGVSGCNRMDFCLTEARG